MYKGRDLMEAVASREMQDIRGAEIAMIFQDPMTSLNPVYKVGWQIAEQLQRPRVGLDSAGRAARTVELLRAVGIPNPERAGG